MLRGKPVHLSPSKHTVNADADHGPPAPAMAAASVLDVKPRELKQAAVGLRLCARSFGQRCWLRGTGWAGCWGVAAWFAERGAPQIDLRGEGSGGCRISVGRRIEPFPSGLAGVLRCGSAWLQAAGGPGETVPAPADSVDKCGDYLVEPLAGARAVGSFKTGGTRWRPRRTCKQDALPFRVQRQDVDPLGLFGRGLAAPSAGLRLADQLPVGGPIAGCLVLPRIHGGQRWQSDYSTTTNRRRNVKRWRESFLAHPQNLWASSGAGRWPRVW